MAEYSLIPTQKMILEARSVNENPIFYLNNKTYSIPRDAGFDARRKDKYGYEYLQDIMITRDDGTKIIIHEMDSDIDSLKKVELSEVDWNNKIVKNILAYTDGLDFSKMQSEQDYLDCLANSLLSQNRLDSKEQIANSYGLEEIYIGSVKRHPKTNNYVKTAKKPDNMMMEDIFKAKYELKRERETRAREETERKNKTAMIKAISNRLQTLSLEELTSICDALEISMDDLNLDNAR